tara:strand:+ start:13297 stop:16335 length:3039 start_codon:yes stop_codon:yes gene_type:complete
MSVKSFKFVSPGVFINEIDNSFIPKSAQAIGAAVIGRSSRGLGGVPVTVESYSDFVTLYGNTVGGGGVQGSGDVYRDGNYVSPMYGTYAAKAYLNANVAPLTYYRVLGQQSTNNDADGGAAGWKTFYDASDWDDAEDGGRFSTNGGAYGMWIFTSGSTVDCGTGSLAAIFYLEQGAVALKGTMRIASDGSPDATDYAAAATVTSSAGAIIGSDSSGNFTLVFSGSSYAEDKISVSFDDTSDNYIRNKINTNPSLVTASNGSSHDFYPTAAEKNYWLGETFDQKIRDLGLAGAEAQAVILPLQNATGKGAHNMKSQATNEAVAGWFIGQDLGAADSYVPFNQQKLFRLKGRGHGEWLHKNAKVSIANVKASTSKSRQYGTFSLIIRQISDTDSRVIVLERYDNCDLDPTSPNFVARKVGDKYYSWDDTERRLKEYGTYTNNSKYVYVEMNPDVELGATDARLLPFGYFGPPKYRDIFQLSGSGGQATAGDANHTDPYLKGLKNNSYITASGPDYGHNSDSTSVVNVISGAFAAALSKGGANTQLSDGAINSYTGSLVFGHVRLRLSASDGGLSNPTDTYFGMQTTRESGSTVNDPSAADFHKLLYSGFPDDPVASGYYGTTGIEAWSYVFSLDDVVSKNTQQFYYLSGSRLREASYTSSSYENILDAGYNKFTAPFWGGFDGLDIHYPDPLANSLMSSNSTNDNDYVYYSLKRAIDTFADPEFINVDLLTVPGLTLDGLTTHLVRVCEDRADAMALIDLADVYLPFSEGSYSSRSTKASRIATTPTSAASALRNRNIDSSYGATFYPWVQTRDDMTGQLLWVPPSVAVLGVLASSQASTDVWFAPAGFNRGGLTDGAAGISVTGVTERLTSKDRDTLYEANINPIASFPSSGIVLFGQKTLQEAQSALDRINVRRLVIYLKKQISILSTQVLFEQNVQATWDRFTGLIRPLLEGVQSRFGITDFRLVLDSSTTTDDLIDQNVLYAKIMVKPARAIEFIAIDFSIMSTGASFDD